MKNKTLTSVGGFNAFHPAGVCFFSLGKKKRISELHTSITKNKGTYVQCRSFLQQEKNLQIKQRSDVGFPIQEYALYVPFSKKKDENQPRNFRGDRLFRIGAFKSYYYYQTAAPLKFSPHAFESRQFLSEDHQDLSGSRPCQRLVLWLWLW